MFTKENNNNNNYNARKQINKNINEFPCIFETNGNSNASALHYQWQIITHISFIVNRREKNWLMEQLESTRNPSWRTGLRDCVMNGIGIGLSNQQTYAISLQRLINGKNDTCQLSDISIPSKLEIRT